MSIFIELAPPQSPLPSVNMATAPRSKLRRPKMLLVPAKSGITATDDSKKAFGTQM